ALMLFILGISNWLNMDEAELLQRQARSNREVVPELLILYLDRFINPSINILMAAMIGGLVGLSYIAPNRSISALSAALGFGLYGFAQFIMIRLITPNTYYGEFKDALGNLRTPNTLIFTLLWLGPPLVAGLTAFA